MKTISLPLVAGQAVRLDGLGDYFHLLETVEPVDIEFMFNGQVQGEARSMEYGFFFKPTGGFSALGFTSATTQTIKYAIGIGDGGYNRTTGAVSILNQQGAHTETQKSVTNANQVLMAANAARRGGLIQNNDAAAVLRVTVDGAAASAARGFRVLAGGVFNLSDYAPSGAIYGCMETATGTLNNVEVAEG